MTLSWLEASLLLGRNQHKHEQPLIHVEEWKISEPLHLRHVTPRGKYLKLWFCFLIFSHSRQQGLNTGWQLGDLISVRWSFSFCQRTTINTSTSFRCDRSRRERTREGNAVKKHQGTPESSCSCRQHWGMKMHAHSRNSHSGSSSDRNSLASNDGKTPTYHPTSRVSLFQLCFKSCFLPGICQMWQMKANPQKSLQAQNYKE